MRSLLAILVALGWGCGDFPCIDESTTHTIESIPFSYTQRVRYTYWFEDGSQRVTFDRDDIPETGRGAVLVHIDGKTSGGLHGAAGWAADVTADATSAAAYVPMAIPRAAAYSAWVAAWRANWIETRVGVISEEIEARASMEKALGLEPEAPPETEDPLAPENLVKALKEPPPKPQDPVDARSALGVPKSLQDQLSEKGISVDGLKLSRALRVTGAREPMPRDFGLSVDVHPTWVFVEQGCDACDAALAWLDDKGIGYHAMLVSDPTNATTLKSLSTRAKVERPAVPSLWKHGKLLRGFDAARWAEELR